jgi:hypothetical protein
VLRRAKELRVAEDDYFFKNRKRGPIDADLALTAGEYIKAIAEQCGTSAQMIEQHYGRYMSSDFFGQRLMAEIEQQTETKTEIYEGDFLNAENGGESWRPRRDLNPCYRRERPVSWAELDDGDVLVSRAGFEPATLCLKGRCSTA